MPEHEKSRPNPKKRKIGDQGSQSYVPSADVFMTANQVAVMTAALNLAQEKPAGYYPLAEAGKVAALKHQAQAKDLALGLNLGLDAGISPSPMGTIYPQPRAEDFDASDYTLNPNSQLVTQTLPDGGRQIVLKLNYSNSYILHGKINGHTVTFLLDTGATQISVPLRVANAIGLKAQGRSIKVHTASGTTDMFETEIDSLMLGDIELRFIPGIINPADRSETVLLGMSALKHFEITQRDGMMILKYLPSPRRTR